MSRTIRVNTYSTVDMVIDVLMRPVSTPEFVFGLMTVVTFVVMTLV
jgi:hypothetical protein